MNSSKLQVEFFLIPLESTLGLRNSIRRCHVWDKSLAKRFFGLVHFWPPEIYFFLSLFPFLSVFLLPGTAPNKPMSKTPVFLFYHCLPSCNRFSENWKGWGRNGGENVTHTHVHSSQSQRVPFQTSVMTLPSFLVQFVHLFRARVKGHWAEPH